MLGVTADFRAGLITAVTTGFGAGLITALLLALGRVFTGVAVCGMGLLGRSVCAPLVLEGGVRLRVGDSGAVLRSGQKPEVSADDT